ncbi:hypothetical protein JCM10213_009072 [Rhodosporidiobolus nylandii]
MARTQRRNAPPSSDEGSATDYSDAPASTSRRKSTQGKGKGKKAAASQGKKRKQRDDSSDVDMDDSDDDSDDGGKRKKGELSEDEKKHYIQAIVRFVLFTEAHRKVLKREDIVKSVLTDGRGKHFNTLFPKVNKVLKEVMGMELHQLRAKEGGAAKNTPKAYILRSTLPTPLIRFATTSPSTSFASTPIEASTSGRKSLRSELVQWEQDEELLPGDAADSDEEGEMGVMRDVKREEGAAYGVLGVVLALILVNNKVLADDQLISLLRRLSLTPSTLIPLTLASPHPTTLTLSAYLNLLLKAQYLERGKSGQAGPTQTQGGAGRTQGPARTQRATADGGVAETGDPSVEWRWGARAEAEIGELGVAKFVERIFHAALPGSAAASQQQEGEGSQGAGGKRGKTGERFMNEIARAAGVKELKSAEEATAQRADE